jgi:hypothetical protein
VAWLAIVLIAFVILLTRSLVLNAKPGKFHPHTGKSAIRRPFQLEILRQAQTVALAWERHSPPAEDRP